MIEINRFSGNVYVTTGIVKENLTDQKTFTKCGDFWLSNDGDIIKDDGEDKFNLTTGIKSTFGDPFNA